MSGALVALVACVAPCSEKKARCPVVGEYLDIAKRVYANKCSEHDPSHGVEILGLSSEKRRARRDTSDISDRRSARTERVKDQNTPLTVGEAVEEINSPRTGASMQANLFRRGEISGKNAIEWVTKAILFRRGMDTSGWLQHAPSVEAALTSPSDREHR